MHASPTNCPPHVFYNNWIASSRYQRPIKTPRLSPLRPQSNLKTHSIIRRSNCRWTKKNPTTIFDNFSRSSLANLRSSNNGQMHSDEHIVRWPSICSFCVRYLASVTLQSRKEAIVAVIRVLVIAVRAGFSCWRSFRYKALLDVVFVLAVGGISRAEPDTLVLIGV